MANVFIIQRLQNDYILLKSGKYRSRNWYLRINRHGTVRQYSIRQQYPAVTSDNHVASALQFLPVYL